VIILKSEYPNGVFRFLGNSHVTMENPTEEKVLRFNIERYGGNQLPVSVDWKISRIPPFIAPTTRCRILILFHQLLVIVTEICET